MLTDGIDLPLWCDQLELCVCGHLIHPRGRSMRLLRSAWVASSLALSVIGLGSASAATITADGSSPLVFGTTLGAGNYGTVAYDFNPTNTAITFTVTLNPGFLFVSGGVDAIFAFTTNTGVSYGPIASTGTGGTNAGWSGIPDGTGTGVKMNGAGNFGGAVTHDGNGGSQPLGSTLTFTITSLTSTELQLLQATGSGQQGLLDHFFAADICRVVAGTTNGTCGTGAQTGIVFDGTQPSEVPLPPAAVLFGTALVGFGLLSRRRKQQLNATA